MIVESLLNVIYLVISAVVSPFHVGSLSPEHISSVDNLIDSIFESAAALIDLFLPWQLILVFLPITIIIINFDDVYRFVMWILRKIPFLGIE